MLATDWQAKLKNGLARAGLLVVVSILLLCYLRSGNRGRFLWGGLLLVTFWFDLVTHVPNQNPTVRGLVYCAGWARQQLHWEPEPALGQSRAMVPASALETLRSSWLPDVEQNYFRNRLAGEVDCNLLDGVPQVDGFFSLVPRETYQITDLACGKHNRAPEGLLDFLGVSKVTALGTQANWTTRRTYMPFVSSGQRAVFADEETTLAALQQTNLDLREVVFLPLEARGVAVDTPAVTATVRKLELVDQKVTFEVDCPAAMTIVISQAFSPAWKARVDNNGAKIWRANHGFQALSLSAGSHKIQLRYADRVFRGGAVLSGLGIIAWFSLWWTAGNHSSTRRPRKPHQ
jgi:hypothetical protein